MACNNDCKNCSQKCDIKDLRENPNKYSSIKKIIGIVSGKGGVGKSFVTSLLATTLSNEGYSVGILDADITGPSIPKMFGLHEQVIGNEAGLLPVQTKNGIKVMSANLLLKNETDPVVWRGPVIAGLVKQFWTDVVWQNVDYLLIDMPPGTGDVPLTVFQSIGVDGIVIVTSPQELVSMIVQKASNMAHMLDIPILGIVENMSYVECSKCHEHIKIFGESHVDEIAKNENVDTVCYLPLNPDNAKLVDEGKVYEISKEFLEAHLSQLKNKLLDLPLDINNIACLVLDNDVSNLEDADSLYIYHTIRQMAITVQRIDIDQLNIIDIIELLKENNVKCVLTNKQESYHGFKVSIEKGDAYDALISFLTRKDKKKVLKRNIKIH